MPIKVPNNLPAVKTLTRENVFVMTDTRAMTQDIRPLQILILNLMPTKVDTETQLTRLLGNTPLQVELELMQTSTHKASNTSEEHMIAFYKTFDQIKDKFYDGMIITGAPVELMEFEEVEYWEELCTIMEWSKRHVHSTFHICWGAQAGLYYHYGIKKHVLDEKLSGVFKHHLDYKKGMLFRGFDDIFYVPHSRNTTVYQEDIEAVPELKIISTSEEAGVFAVKSESDRQIFIMGHSEYDSDTLKKEYDRDKAAGINPKVPCNYYPDDDDTKEPVVLWRSCANLIYSNWLNYFVYQSTPYDINSINEETMESLMQKQDVNLKVAKFGGSSLSDAKQFMKVFHIVKAEEERRYIVVSAPGKSEEYHKKVTDILIQCAENPDRIEEQLSKVIDRYRKIVEDLDIKIDIQGEFDLIKNDIRAGKAKDYIVSRGEYLNAKILACLLDFDFVDAAECVFFDEEGNYDDEKTMKILRQTLKEHDFAVIPGFYGSMPDGQIKTFPRGGSDITGAIVSAAANADIYENWTDVSGMLMADPRVVDNPLTVPVITYKELRELSYMGADVMHEDTVFPVVKMEIPINIRNTNKPADSGTLIVRNADYFSTNLAISGISGKVGYSSIAIEKDKMSDNPQIRKDVLDILSGENIQIKNLVAGIDSLNIIVPTEDISTLKDQLIKKISQQINANSVSISDGLALIAIVGRDIGNSPAIAVKVLRALANRKINIESIDHGSEKINILIGVKEEEYIKAVKAIYTEFTGLIN